MPSSVQESTERATAADRAPAAQAFTEPTPAAGDSAASTAPAPAEPAAGKAAALTTAATAAGKAPAPTAATAPAAAISAGDAPADGDVAASETATPKRRPGRPRKTAAVKAKDQQAKAQGEGAPSESAGDAKPAKRRGRPRKVVAEQADGFSAQESPEVMQARALAQVSQASVVRRQRRAADRAAEMLAADDSAASTAPVAPTAPAKQPDITMAQSERIQMMIDPALRPNRRGRKPKAYVEAEKAAAAALAAEQAALMAERDRALAAAAHAQASTSEDAEGSAAATAERVEDSSAEPVAVGELAVKADVAADREAPKAQDVRPGRAGRGKKREARVKDSQPALDAAADAAASANDASEETSRGEGKPSRRSHKDRRDADRAQKGDRADRNDKPESDRAAERRERRERQKEHRKQRNNRFAPTEPTLTRDELAAMKVAELREKARELEIDPTGIKKSELVEVVYAAAARAEGFRDIEGILDIDHQGFGYIRAHGYMPSRDDAFVPAQMIRAAGLRPGDYVAGSLRPMRANDKLPGLAKLHSVNGVEPDKVKARPKFADLTPIYPNEPLKMEHGRDSITGRAIDIVSPIGKGQRGLIVSPPKAGKTTILKKICQSIAINNPEVHLICLLVDERPEEVTDMQRSIKGDVVASTFDMPADNHTRVSELVIERAKRIVELGGDVVVVLDSITRLARAYNLAAPASGRILSGGVDSAALYPPKRFLGAARNIENGGSLTILASALVDTGSKMDEVIFEEFKGTGNMELKLDRDLADRRIFPAIDPIASGTRNEDLLVDEQMRPFVWGIRRILAGMNNTERAAASFIKGLKGTNSNQDFLIRTAKKAADHPDAL